MTTGRLYTTLVTRSFAAGILTFNVKRGNSQAVYKADPEPLPTRSLEATLKNMTLLEQLL